jgi:hypothetical protein
MYSIDTWFNDVRDGFTIHLRCRTVTVETCCVVVLVVILVLAALVGHVIVLKLGVQTLRENVFPY